MRKYLPTILIYFFLLVFIIQIACLVALLVIPQPGQAADFTPQVSIPGSKFEKGGNVTVSGSTKTIGDYIKAIYNYSIGIVGILATVVLMFGGVMWIMAGGNAERVGSAKAWIGAALTGLVLALCSYVILNTVNPDLVNLKVTTIQEAKDNSLGCCEKPKNESTCSLTTKSNCENGWGGKGYTCNTLGKCSNDILASNGPEGTIYHWMCLPMSESCESYTIPPTITYDRSVCEEKLGPYTPCTNLKYPQSICCGLTNKAQINGGCCQSDYGSVCIIRPPGSCSTGYHWAPCNSSECNNCSTCIE